MKVTVLPEATREQMLDAAGLDGSARWSDAEAGNQQAPHDPEVEDFLLGDGWSIASLEGGRQAGGMTTHRGALHPDEYETLDHDIVREKVEALLGFTYAEVSAVYDITGRPTADQTQKRSQIDSALLGGRMNVVVSLSHSR